MQKYEFENRYGGQTKFLIGPQSMTILVAGGRGYQVEYRFYYADIKTYTFSTTPHGYHELTFMSIGKNIERVEGSKRKYVSSCFTSIKARVTGEVNSSSVHKIAFSDTDQDIRKIILHNTPLRSQFDLYAEKQNAIRQQFLATPAHQFSQITITGIKNIEDSVLYGPRDNIAILLNDVTVITLHKRSVKQELMRAGLYDDHPVNPTWLDNKTLSFRIPYGEWDLRYNIHQHRSDNTHLPSDKGSRNIHLSLSPETPFVNLKVKTGWLSTKLVIV